MSCVKPPAVRSRSRPMISATACPAGTGLGSSAGGSGRAYGWPAIRSSSLAISRGRKTWSILPSRTADRGMPGWIAVISSLAKVAPPPALIACSAITLSDPLPERITPTARAFWIFASDRSRWSIGMFGTGRGGRVVSVRCPSVISMMQPGGRT